MTASRSKRSGQNRTGKGTRKQKQQCVQKRPLKLRFPHSTSPYLRDQHLTNPINVKKSAKPVIKRIFQWCFNRFPNPWKILSSTARIILSSRSRSIDFESTRRELQETKKELDNVKQKVEELEVKVEELKKKSLIQSGPQNPCSIPPPPPPPPPVMPPVARVKATIVQTPKKLKQDREKPSAPCILRDDILKVKLRKLDRFACKDDEKENQNPSALPRITLLDLSSVSLKPLDRNSRLNDAQKENNPSQSVLLKKILRKTTMKRSPGGTPMVTRSTSCLTGSGPTPEITRALQRKFRSLKISPLAVLENSRSPTLES